LPGRQAHTRRTDGTRTTVAVRTSNREEMTVMMVSQNLQIFGRAELPIQAQSLHTPGTVCGGGILESFLVVFSAHGRRCTGALDSSRRHAIRRG
jgi:hypothetical protein